MTQFLGQIMRGQPIQLVDGGQQRRAFADVSDGVDALVRIIRNEGGRASGRIFGAAVQIRVLLRAPPKHSLEQPSVPT